MRLDDELIEEFLVAAREQFAGAASTLAAVDPAAALDAATIALLIRSTHAIKEASSLIGLRRIHALAHAIASVLQAFRSGELSPNGESVDGLRRGFDRLGELLAMGQASNDEDVTASLDDLRGRLFAAAAAKAALSR